jgi:hypothetical protein
MKAECRSFRLLILLRRNLWLTHAGSEPSLDDEYRTGRKLHDAVGTTTD